MRLLPTKQSRLYYRPYEHTTNRPRNLFWKLGEKRHVPILDSHINAFASSIVHHVAHVGGRRGSVGLSRNFPSFSPPGRLLSTLTRATCGNPRRCTIAFNTRGFHRTLTGGADPTLRRRMSPGARVYIAYNNARTVVTTVVAVYGPNSGIVVFSPFCRGCNTSTVLSNTRPVCVPLIPPACRFSVDLVRGNFTRNTGTLVLYGPSGPYNGIFHHSRLRTVTGLTVRCSTFIIASRICRRVVCTPTRRVYVTDLPNVFRRAVAYGSLSGACSVAN